MISILKRKISKIFLKVTAVLVGGVIVSVVFLVSMDTHSWFTSKIEGKISMTAAATEDIVEKIKVEKTNPKEIILKKSQNSTTDPIIYFCAEGDIKEYIKHINPISLEDEDKEYDIPIKVSVNFYEYVKLLFSRDKKITGEIKIKYLNEFVNESREIEFTKKYLLEQFWKDIKNIQALEENDDSDSEEVKELVKIIKYIAGCIAWKEVAIVEEALETVKNKDVFTVSVGKVELSEEQNEIIEIVAPGLLKYIEKLYDAIEKLTSNLNEKIAQINGLEQTVEMLNIEVEGLKTEKTDLENQNKELITAKEELIKQNIELEENMEQVLSENDELKRRNSSLSNTNVRLREENRALLEENQRLHQIISELTTQNDDDTVIEDVYGN